MAEKIIVGEISQGDHVHLGMDGDENITWKISSPETELA
jgi:hypothetical protein